MIPFDAVIFDLDGTLVDSIPDVTASVNFALKQFGSGQISQTDTRDLVGLGARPLIVGAMERTGLPLSDHQADAILQMFLDRYKINPATLSRLYDGVTDTLDVFKKAGIKMAICTNKPAATTHPVLEAFDLSDYFSSIRCGDSVPHKKPDARHVRLCLDDLGVDEAASVFVGDSETDIKAAQNARLPSVCVTYGYCHQAYDTLGATALIDDFTDLVPALNRIRNKHRVPS